MRSHGKRTDKFPDTPEIRLSIDEHEDLVKTEKISKAIQQILDI